MQTTGPTPPMTIMADFISDLGQSLKLPTHCISITQSKITSLCYVHHVMSEEQLAPSYRNLIVSAFVIVCLENFIQRTHKEIETLYLYHYEKYKKEEEDRLVQEEIRTWEDYSPFRLFLEEEEDEERVEDGGL